MANTRLLAASPALVLMQDHRRIRQLFQDHAQLGPENPEGRESLFRQIRHELVLHGAIERDHVYPSMKDSLPSIWEDHAAIEGLMEKLAEMNVGDKSYDALMKLLEENFSLHADGEERELFPRLNRLSPLARQELTLKLENAREQIGKPDEDPRSGKSL